MDQGTEKLKNQRPEIRPRASVLSFVSSSVGLTLVELMVTVSILSIGIVLVARALLTASAALDSVANRIEAIQFLEAKMADLRQQAYAEEGVRPEQLEGTLALRHRTATWRLEIVPVEPEAFAREGSQARGSTSEERGSPAEGSAVELAEVRLSLSWQEGPRAPDAVLVTYLGYTAEPGEKG